MLKIFIVDDKYETIQVIKKSIENAMKAFQEPYIIKYMNCEKYAKHSKDYVVDLFITSQDLDFHMVSDFCKDQKGKYNRFAFILYYMNDYKLYQRDIHPLIRVIPLQYFDSQLEETLAYYFSYKFKERYILYHQFNYPYIHKRSEVLYIEKTVHQKKCRMVLVNHKTKMIDAQSLEELYSKLNHNHWFFVSKRFIVNIDNIEDMRDYIIYFRNGEKHKIDAFAFNILNKKRRKRY